MRALTSLGRPLQHAIREITKRQATMSPSAYAAWSKDDLIARIQSLEAVLASDPKIPPEKVPRPQIPSTNQTSQGKSKKAPKLFDINAYPKRKIALKFCYAGWEYNGLAFQTDPTPLPMVEAVLLKALGDCRCVVLREHALNQSLDGFCLAQADRPRARIRWLWLESLRSH